MTIVCLDMEGVLVPEIWIAVSKKHGRLDFTPNPCNKREFNKEWRFCP